MKKKFLHSTASTWQIKKAFKPLAFLVLLFTFSLKSFAHRVETYIFSCVSPGQAMIIDAEVQDAPAISWYNWQYKVGGGPWTCFVNGANTINGTSFIVSGASSQNVLNDVPTLTINNASAALENVLVRVVLRDGGDPCTGPAGTVFNGDDLAQFETKYLRLHVFSNAAVCPPNAYLCQGNLLVDANGYYGGFENKVYNASTDSYTNNNFGPTAGSSDFILGMGIGHYQDINNPYAMTSAFARDIAPHTGSTQMVVMGSFSPADRVWYKTVSVNAGTAYAFDVWAARVDNTSPRIALKVNGATIQESDLSVQPIGNWVRISGQYNSSAAGTVVISISDNNGGVSNNYVLDDLCFRVCTNCGTLPLNNLDLRTALQGNNVAVKWTAENEVNTSVFVIERSADGVNFFEVGTVQASGQTNTLKEYSSSDDILAVGNANVLYYRIKAVDIDGRFTHSNISTVRLSKKAGIQIWPSPFTDKISISYNASVNTKIDVSIVNTAGKVVSQTNYSVSRGLNQLSVNSLNALSSGVYIVRITDMNSNESFIQKITK